MTEICTCVRSQQVDTSWHMLMSHGTHMLMSHVTCEGVMVPVNASFRICQMYIRVYDLNW